MRWEAQAAVCVCAAPTPKAEFCYLASTFRTGLLYFVPERGGSTQRAAVDII